MELSVEWSPVSIFWSILFLTADAGPRLQVGGKRVGKRARARASAAMDDSDILKIMIASDMHLGYAEKDPRRGEDSFNSFEELFVKANEHKVWSTASMHGTVGFLLTGPARLPCPCR